MEQQQEIRKTSLQRAIERRYGGQDIRLVIRDAYRDLGSLEAVAEELGVSRNSLSQWLEDFKAVQKTDLEFPGLRLPDPEPAEPAAV